MYPMQKAPILAFEFLPLVNFVFLVWFGLNGRVNTITVKSRWSAYLIKLFQAAPRSAKHWRMFCPETLYLIMSPTGAGVQGKTLAIKMHFLTPPSIRAHSFARNWQLSTLNPRKGENDYLRMLLDPTGHRGWLWSCHSLHCLLQI